MVSDFVGIVSSLCNLIQNGRTAAYNEGVDAERARVEVLMREMAEPFTVWTEGREKNWEQKFSVLAKEFARRQELARTYINNGGLDGRHD